MLDEITSQQKANIKQNKKRLATPTFSTVRFKSKERLDEIMSTIELFGGTKEDSLIEAYRLLKESLTPHQK